jgi:putrescine importer
VTITLTRTLKLPSLVLFGLAYLTPLIVLGIFGIIAEATGGASPAAYLVALIAMLFTAHSYGRMAIAYPVAGSAYTYVRRSIDPRVGFLVGWAILLDYLFLPMVIWLIGGSYLSAQFPGIPIGLWIVGFIVITTLLNILGIKVADKANYVLMAFQLLVIVFFVALSIGNVVSTFGAGGLVSSQPFVNDTSSFATISAGAAIAAYSFLGFDAVTTLTEETVQPRKNDAPRHHARRADRRRHLRGRVLRDPAGAPRRGVRGLGVRGQLHRPADRRAAVRRRVPGRPGGGAVRLRPRRAGQRLPPAVRDGPRLGPAQGGLRPAQREVPHPVVNLVITGIVGLIAIFLDVATSTSFINFGAFTAFTLVNASVVFHYVRQRRAGHQLNGVLRGGPGDRSHHLRLPALTAGQQRHYAGSVLAGAGHGGPGPDHARLQGGAAGNDGNGEGDG